MSSDLSGELLIPIELKKTSACLIVEGKLFASYSAIEK